MTHHHVVSCDLRPVERMRQRQQQELATLLALELRRQQVLSGHVRAVEEKKRREEEVHDTSYNMHQTSYIMHHASYIIHHAHGTCLLPYHQVLYRCRLRTLLSLWHILCCDHLIRSARSRLDDRRRSQRPASVR